MSSFTVTDMRPSGQISTLETRPPPSNTPLTARRTSASVNLVFDMLSGTYVRSKSKPPRLICERGNYRRCGIRRRQRKKVYETKLRARNSRDRDKRVSIAAAADLYEVCSVGGRVSKYKKTSRNNMLCSFLVVLRAVMNRVGSFLKSNSWVGVVCKSCAHMFYCSLAFVLDIAAGGRRENVRNTGPELTLPL
jgi:hypothetical protein